MWKKLTREPSFRPLARKWHGWSKKGGPEAVHAMSYVITAKAASVERELEIFPQQGNNEEDSSNKKNRNKDERQNLLFLPLLIPIVRKVPSCLEKIAWIPVPQLFGTACRLEWRGKRQASHRFE